MAPKGCWTCKDRKISCDRTIPKCLKCTKSKRKCGGYGMRLTWPHEDRNRAVVGLVPTTDQSFFWHEGAYQWINVVPTDIRLHLVTSTPVGKSEDGMTRQQITFPNIPESILTNPNDAATGELELLRYFENVVVDILPSLYTDRTRLRHFILKIALSNRNQSSRAVYHSVLALASYHRGSDLLYVDRMKRSALRELYTDMELTMCEGVEHVAANLLLCVLEMQQTTGKNSGWVGFANGVKQVIHAVQKTEPTEDCGAYDILGWVYYFDVMARFSYRHWRTEHVRAIVDALGSDSNGSGSCRIQSLLARGSFARRVPNISVHAHPVVRLLAEVADTALYSTDPRYLSIEYQQHLDELRSSLENVSPRSKPSPDGLDSTERPLELTRLAGLIHLERISRNFSGQSAVIESWTTQALSIIAQLDSCLCPFALFIVGCETDKDADRMIILDLYARMETRPYLKSFMEGRALIQTAWNMQDLAEDGELEYIQKLNIVMSSRDVVPSLI